MKKPPGNSARLAALSLLEAVMDEGLNLGEANDSHRPPDARDRAFARHLAFGVFRWLTALEWLAQQLLKRPFKTRDRDIHRLILIGIFELWKGGSPPHAAINEAVKLALAEDAEDLAALDERATEPSLPFEDVVKDLKRRGKI